MLVTICPRNNYGIKKQNADYEQKEVHVKESKIRFGWSKVNYPSALERNGCYMLTIDGFMFIMHIHITNMSYYTKLLNKYKINCIECEMLI